MSHQPEGTPCTCNLPGWMPGVEHLPILWGLPVSIANHQGEMEPAVVVDHIMQGYLSTMVEWRRTGDSKVIVHFGIDRTGRIVQFHRADTRGIHASAFDAKSPHVAKQVKQRNTSPNNYSVGIEHEGCSVDPRYGGVPMRADMVYGAGNPWPEAMVQASIRVHRWLFATLPTLGAPSTESIIGHYETGDPNRINDPAAASNRSVWPRDRIIAAITTRPSLTAAQRERLEYLESPAGRGIVEPLRGNLLAEVGLPRKARLADYAPTSDSSPSPEEPKQEVPPPPVTPDRYEEGRRAGRRDLARELAPIAALATTHAQSLRDRIAAESAG